MTMLRMIAGLEAISSGDISIDGNVVNQLAPMDRDMLEPGRFGQLFLPRLRCRRRSSGTAI
jgi:ABC-type polar amino acid transport system ATPase subunit